MKLRYLALAGLFIIMLGCFLPFRVDLWESKSAGFWFLPVPAIFFILISKEGPFGTGRTLGGVFGLLIAVTTVFSIIDIISMPYASGIRMAYQAPVTILIGCILACIGGFANYTRTASRNFHLGTILSLTSIGIYFLIELLGSHPPILPFVSLLKYNPFWLIIFCLAVICIGSIIIIKESRRAIQ